LWTLQVGLGEAFTPELREAWASAYHMLSGRMMDAAREVTQPPRDLVGLAASLPNRIELRPS
jgi:hemoglobin-like flavoprotein